MSTNKLVLQNTFFQILGKMVMVICSLGIVKLITSIGQGFYGDYVTTYEFLAFFGIIADAGLFAIAVKEMSQEKAKAETILGNILSIRLLLILGVCALSIVVAQLIPTYDPRVKTGIYITAVSMGLTIIAGTLSSVLQARMKIQYFSGSLALSKVLLLGGTFFLIQKYSSCPANFSCEGGFSLTGTIFENLLFRDLLYAGLISNLIFLGCVAFFASRLVRITLRFDWNYWRETFRVSLPYGLALILQTLYLRLDILLISILLTSQATGIYGVCARIMESFLVVGVFFGQAMLPKISKEASNERAASQTLTWAIEKILLLVLPIIWGVLLFSDQIVVLLSNADFLSTSQQIGSEAVLRLLIPTVLFAYLNQLFTFTLVSKNRQNHLLIVNLIAVLFNGGLNWYFLPIYGIKAAALTTVASEILVLSCLGWEIRKHFRPQLFNARIRFILALNMLVLALVYHLPFLKENLLPAILFSAILYGGIVWFLRPLLFYHEEA